MPDTPTFIQAVPWEPARTRIAVDLHAATGGTIIWDKTFDPLDTWMDMLAAAGDEPALMLEDDIVLAPAWRQRVEEVIAKHGDRMILFFSMLEEEGPGRWMPSSKYYGTLCAYFPAGYAAQILEFAKTLPHAQFRIKHDQIAGRWLGRRGEKFWLEVPSLVQHRDDLPSAVRPARASLGKRISPSFGKASL